MCGGHGVRCLCATQSSTGANAESGRASAATQSETAIVEPAPAKPGRCTARLMITSTRVSYAGGDVKGDVPFTPGQPPALPRVYPLDGSCDATMWAIDSIPYQDVINVMDVLLSHDVNDIGLDDPDAPSSGRSIPPVQGRPSREQLQAAPLITMTTTHVTFNGARIGRVDDPKLDATLAAKLPPKPADPLIILQADRTLRFGAIRRAVKAAMDAGYYNMMFATKSR